jgi:hypothetical protein
MVLRSDRRKTGRGCSADWIAVEASSVVQPREDISRPPSPDYNWRKEFGTAVTASLRPRASSRAHGPSQFAFPTIRRRTYDLCKGTVPGPLGNRRTDSRTFPKPSPVPSDNGGAAIQEWCLGPAGIAFEHKQHDPGAYIPGTTSFDRHGHWHGE